MYGGPPPGFQPQGYPPFPPQGQSPGQGPGAPGFPPFAAQGGARPPFPPNGGAPGFPPFAPPPTGFNGPPQGFAPPAQAQGSPYGHSPGPGQGVGMPPPSFPGGPGARPPPGMPVRPGAPGLGFQGMPGMPPFPPNQGQAGSPGSMPMPPGMPGQIPGQPFNPMMGPPPGFMGGPMANPNFVKPAVKTTAVFVGGIPGGVSDSVLIGLIQTCGPLHHLKRVTGANGKPQAFGFAEFEDPEVVLRCLKCLNGVAVPDMTPEGRRQGLKKNLVVKADEKTRSFLDEYEQNMMRTEHDDEQDESAKRRIAHIVEALADPNADLGAILPSFAAPDASAQPDPKVGEDGVPTHLRDLDEAELPEQQRNLVLGQINIFRAEAAAREARKKAQEEAMDRQRGMRGPGPGPGQGPGPGGYGPQGGFNRQGPPPHQQNQNARSWGPGPQQHGQNSGYGQEQGVAPIGNGPQSYNRPVGFVRGGQNEMSDDLPDEERERLRQNEKQRRHDAELADRERRLEARERTRMAKLSKEANELRQQDAQEESARRRGMEKLGEWDDDEKKAKGRELFYSDRGRWRAGRSAYRRREYQDDVRDRQMEEEEKVALEKESEDFLQQQMQEMADMEAKQRAAGMLFDDAAPVKLAISNAAPAKIEPVSVKTEPSKPKAPAVSFGAEEDDEEAVRRKRHIIKLDDGDAKLKAGAKLVDIKLSLPKSSRDLFEYRISWDAVNDLLDSKIHGYVRKRIGDFLGELEDEDLVNFTIQLLKDRSRPDAVIEGLEPVLEDDAKTLATDLWRLLAFETAAAAAGVPTGSTLP